MILYVYKKASAYMLIKYYREKYSEYYEYVEYHESYTILILK